MIFLLRLFLAVWMLALAGCRIVPTEPAGPTRVDLSPFYGQPPAPTLEINGQTQTAGVGSYCWRQEKDGQNGVDLCADMIGIPTPLEALKTNSPLKASFILPVPVTPSELVLNLRPVNAEHLIERNLNLGLAFWSPAPGRSIALARQSPPEVNLELQPGQYVFEVFGRWPGLGDASFGFLVEVEE